MSWDNACSIRQVLRFELTLALAILGIWFLYLRLFKTSIIGRKTEVKGIKRENQNIAEKTGRKGQKPVDCLPQGKPADHVILFCAMVF